MRAFFVFCAPRDGGARLGDEDVAAAAAAEEFFFFDSRPFLLFIFKGNKTSL